MKTVKLRITKTDAKRCKEYVDCDNCLIATAAKRQFRTNDITAVPNSVFVFIGSGFYRLRYSYSLADERKVRRSYVEWGNPKIIKPGFKPFTIILTGGPL